MGVAEDFLALAERLAEPAAAEPEQASFRRSVSTAYFALFHLLVQEAVQAWNGTPEVRAGLERRFEHRTMRVVSGAIANGSWRGWSAASLAVPAELRAVAEVFVDLQGARHQADYDNSKMWTPTDVREKVAEVRAAFQSWQSVRAHPAANQYLLSLLLGGRKE